MPPWLCRQLSQFLWSPRNCCCLCCCALAGLHAQESNIWASEATVLIYCTALSARRTRHAVSALSAALQALVASWQWLPFLLLRAGSPLLRQN